MSAGRRSACVDGAQDVVAGGCRDRGFGDPAGDVGGGRMRVGDGDGAPVVGFPGGGVKVALSSQYSVSGAVRSSAMATMGTPNDVTSPGSGPDVVSTMRMAADIDHCAPQTPPLRLGMTIIAMPGRSGGVRDTLTLEPSRECPQWQVVAGDDARPGRDH